MELKKIKFFLKRVELKHFFSKSPVEAFKCKYDFKEKPYLDLDCEEFNNKLKLNPAKEFNPQMSFSLDEIKSPILTTPYNKLEGAAIDFLMKRKPQTVCHNKLTNFVESVFKEYKFVPYHNFAHGISVMQFFNSFVQKFSQVDLLFDKNHVFVSLIAALSHDIGHPGKNNAYNFTKKTKLAIDSMGKAVLEKFHIKKTLYLLSQPSNNIFSELGEVELKQAQQLIIESILATDMADHFNMISKFSKTKLSDFKKNDNFLTGYIIHAGDLGNICLEFDEYSAWAKLITQEFQSQTEAEKRNQLKETEFMKFKGKESFVNDQLSFASFLIRHFCSSTFRFNRRKI